MKKVNSIMLIDDDKVTNFYHKIVIQGANCCEHIDIYDDATEALSHLKETSELPNIIFLDINMPRMNGWEFIETIMEDGLDSLLNTCTIVMLTTSLNPKDKEKALKYKIISEFKHKPLTKEILQDIVVKI